VERDSAASAALKKAGWKVAVVWECETKNPDTVRNHLLKALKQARPREVRRERGS
jgi:DNA mismatch endonuclease (patch repair protein)